MHIHFIGIGGIGMSAIAQAALARGHRVSGSDPAENAQTRLLQSAGATVYRTQVAGNIERERPDLVIATAAIKDDNAELAAVKAAGIKIVIRAEMLGQLMAESEAPRIAVTGTHGKSTTTAMLASILLEDGRDPIIFIGAEYARIGGNAHIGSGPGFLTEACEAYDSFIQLRPDVAVLTNVEADHLDYYGSEERLLESFKRFVGQTTGVVIANGNDPGTQKIAGDMAAQWVWYGNSNGLGDCYWLEDTGCVRRRRSGNVESLGLLTLPAIGQHNRSNAVGAAAAALEIGIPFETVARALAGFTGIGRRFETIGDVGGIRVIDDYAHHPTEIRATLSAAREAFPDRRIVAVFQPHLYSRTRDFMDRFAEELSVADALILAKIYPAREKPIPGIESNEIVRRIAQIAPAKTVLFQPTHDAVVEALGWIARPGDVVLIMGAGDIREAGERFVAGMMDLK